MCYAYVCQWCAGGGYTADPRALGLLGDRQYLHPAEHRHACPQHGDDGLEDPHARYNPVTTVKKLYITTQQKTTDFKEFTLKIGGFGGDKRDRTADLLNAIQALSQLSYTPILVRCSPAHEYYNRCRSKMQHFFTSFFISFPRQELSKNAIAARGKSIELRKGEWAYLEGLRG